MTIYRYDPIGDLANTESFGSITFEVRGYKKPRVEEAKKELIKVLTPKLDGLKRDPERNRYTVEFIQQQINRFPVSWKVTTVNDKVLNN
jgi:hypothetical protein